MIHRVLVLIAGSLLLWGLVAGIAYLLNSGFETIALSAVALAICLIPAVVTLVATELFAVNRPEMVGVIWLGGSLVRMGVAGAAAILLPQRVELFQREGWLYWVIGSYLVVLMLEAVTIVVGRVPPTT